MKKTRQNVFETNSSSTHSISISPNTTGIYDTIPSKNGVITLTGGDFGWGWEKYNDALTKANYLAHYAKGVNNFFNVIREQTGCEVKFKVKGYIDHQSCGVGLDLLKDKKRLRDFIFNKESYLYIGNDNSNPPNKFYDKEDEVYTHRLIIENNDLFWDFKSKPTRYEISKALDTLLWNQYYCKKTKEIRKPSKSLLQIYKVKTHLKKKKVWFCDYNTYFKIQEELSKKFRKENPIKESFKASDYDKDYNKWCEYYNKNKNFKNLYFLTFKIVKL